MVIENIEIKYGKRIIIKSSTLRVEPHGITSILGRNGTGKSSIMNSIYGLNSVKDIIISFNGVVVKKPYLSVGLLNYISQNKCHPDFLTVDDILVGYSIKPSIFIDKYPLFIDNRSLKLGELSYGFRRLFVILVAIEANVRYTILDEPFSSIMPVHNELIIAAIKSVVHRKGILLSDHQYRTVLSITDKLYLLHKNGIELIKNYAELIEYGYLSEGTTLD